MPSPAWFISSTANWPVKILRCGWKSSRPRKRSARPSAPNRGWTPWGQRNVSRVIRYPINRTAVRYLASGQPKLEASAATCAIRQYDLAGLSRIDMRRGDCTTELGTQARRYRTFGPEAGPVVLDAQHQPAVFRTSAEQDLRVRKPGCILYRRFQRKADQIRIEEPKRGRALRQLQPHARRRLRQHEAGCYLIQEVVGVVVARRRDQSTRLRTIQRQERDELAGQLTGNAMRMAH